MYRRFKHQAGGFTLLEVVAALLIAAVALTGIIQSQSTNIRNTAGTRDLRQATMLAQTKLQEVVTGIEQEAGGDFEELPDWHWEVTMEPLSAGFGTKRITLTLAYRTAGRDRTLKLERITR